MTADPSTIPEPNPVLPPAAVVMLPGSTFMAASVIVAAAVAIAGRFVTMPLWLLAAEVLVTILGLFLFGSFKYQIHKNALTYGMLLVIIATFSGLATSAWHVEIATQGWWAWTRLHLLSFRGLDELIHADTMLFILGLTFFVSVIAQTRVLEGITFFLLKRNRGAILPTVISITMVVAFTSGILDGVSMIGLTIRTLVIIMMLAAAPIESVRYAVMVCTAVTTICGIWLAYGEPPNLIMKANLYPYLDNAFFLRYCAPAAVASYIVIAWQLRGKLGGQRIDLDNMDILDANAADVRFLQASRHGEVMTPVELIEGHAADLSGKTPQVIERLRNGESLGIALIRADVSEPTRRDLLAHYVTEELADGLDNHYIWTTPGCTKKRFAPNWPSTKSSQRWPRSAVARRKSEQSPWCRSPRCWSRTASTTRCRCSWRPLPGSWRRFPVSRGSRRCAGWRCAKPSRNMRSTTFCFRFFCRLRS